MPKIDATPVRRFISGSGSNKQIKKHIIDTYKINEGKILFILLK